MQQLLDEQMKRKLSKQTPGLQGSSQQQQHHSQQQQQEKRKQSKLFGLFNRS
jgi:hypothetical protein